MEYKPADFRINSLKPDLLLITVAGFWKMGQKTPSAEELIKQVEYRNLPKIISFATENLQSWDSSLLIFLIKILGWGQKKGIKIDKTGLPPGIQRLLKLSTAVREIPEVKKEINPDSFPSLVGAVIIDWVQNLPGFLAFIGEVFLGGLKIFIGKAGFQPSELLTLIQRCGISALPLVSLITLLVGLILAFVGAVQLRMFGAQIYVADLVGIGMVRVLGAVMTGIIMAGRIGASFAAELGTMQVNDEIDALKTFGISPLEFLVVPRMIALTLMMPLLCLYADFMGIMGGLIVGIGILDLEVIEYINETRMAVDLTDVWIGIFHGIVFGVLVALSGCLRGIQCGKSASAVGKDTTSAVVTSIVSITIATAIITFICDVLGI